MNTGRYILSLIILSIFFFTSCGSSDSGDKNAGNTGNSDSALLKHNTYSSSDSSTYSQRPVDTTYAEPISGMVEDANSKQVYIKVFPSRSLNTVGLSLEEIATGKRGKDVKQAVAAIFSVRREFTGNLMIKAFDYNKNLLGKSTAKLKGIMGDRKTISFSFPTTIDFTHIDYCTIGFEE